MGYYFYFVLAMGCFIGELFTMDFSLTCIGIGLLGAGVATWMGLGIGSQAVLFVCVSLLAFISIRPFAKKWLYMHTKNVKTNVDALIGRTVTVITAPDEEHIGRVQTDGDNWRAYFDTDAKEGDKVIVKKMDGNTLFVTTKSQEEK